MAVLPLLPWLCPHPNPQQHGPCRPSSLASQGSAPGEAALRCPQELVLGLGDPGHLGASH